MNIKQNIPTVSISCITYNHSRFIRNCLDGFLMQKTTFEYEILIHDDASNDGTIEIIKEYEYKYPGLIKSYIQKENQYSKGQRGINAKYNIPRAKGKYIALCEGDDFWTDPYKLQKQVDFLDQNEEYIGCFTNAMIVDDVGEELGLFLKYNENKKFEIKHIIQKGGGMFPTPSLMFRNIITDFPPLISKVQAGDWFLMLLIADKGPVYLLNETTCSYRIHEKGVNSSIANIRSIRNMYSLFSIKYLDEFNQYTSGRYNKYIKKNNQ